MTTDDARLMFPGAYQRGYLDGWEHAMRALGSAVHHHPDNPNRSKR